MSLSVLGTLAATAVLSELKSEWALRPAAPAVVEQSTGVVLPSLTQGGKFAARASGGEDPETSVTLMSLPAILPLFTAPTVPRLGVADAEPPVAVAAPANEVPGLPAFVPTGRISVHRDSQRLASVPPLPPRRGTDPVTAVVAVPISRASQAAAPEEHSVWSRSKAAYQMVAAWSGALVETVLP